jgi:hypothetical protein
MSVKPLPSGACARDGARTSTLGCRRAGPSEVEAAHRLAHQGPLLLRKRRRRHHPSDATSNTRHRHRQRLALGWLSLLWLRLRLQLLREPAYRPRGVSHLLRNIIKRARSHNRR